MCVYKFDIDEIYTSMHIHRNIQDTNKYPEEKFVKSQVFKMSCIRNTRGLFQTGGGMREKA